MTRHVTEAEVYQAFGEIANKLIAQRPEVVAACEEVLAVVMDTGDVDAKKERLRSGNGTCVHPTAPERGNCGCKGKGDKIWTASTRKTRGIWRTV